MAIDPGDSAHARELARKSADRRAAGKLPPDLESFTILDWLDKWGEFRDPSWAAWRTCLAAIFGLPLSPDELVTYQRHTGRPEPPTQPVQEAWLVCGRKAGKSAIADVHPSVAAAMTFVDDSTEERLERILSEIRNEGR